MNTRFDLTLGLALAVATATHAGQVALQLDSVTSATCTEEYDGYYGNYWNCTPDAPLALSPALPQGAGSTIDLDTRGDFIGGTVVLEAHTQGGIAIPAWSRTLVRTPPSSMTSSADSGIGPWPPPPLTPESTEATAWLQITRFAGQGDFDGTITVRQDSVVRDAQGVGTRTVFQENYVFSAIPGSPLACAGDRLYLDYDGDGEEDSRDAKSYALDTSFGAGVDGLGLSIAEYCSAQSIFTCQRADFRNDEPLRKKPGDCARVRVSQGVDACRPAEFAQAIAIGARRTCQGLPLFADADGDGEPDATDACPGTPAGDSIDERGCSVDQFCAAQPVASCKRADFLNDEPLLKKPGDCRKTKTKPRACEAVR
jgi:hypothetical protein